jgi:thiol:disulfide interchange protein
MASGIHEARHPLVAPDHVRWRPWDRALEQARAEGKPLLYQVTADWCPACRQLTRDVLANREAAALINALFVPVRIVDRRREDGANPPEAQELLDRHGVTSLPTLIVVSPSGQTRLVLRGYQGRDLTLKRLEAAATLAPARRGVGATHPAQLRRRRR